MGNYKEVDSEELNSGKGKSSYKEIDSDEFEAPEVNESTAGSPYLTGFGQGLSSRFGDEGTAAIEAALNGTKYRDVWERKQKELNYLRAMYPAEMMASEAAGSIGSFLLPGALLGKVPKIAAMLPKGKMIIDAIQGAMSGAGGSENTITGSPLALAGDTALGAVEGAAAGKVLRLAAPYAAAGLNEYVKPGVQKLTDFALKHSAGPLFKVPAPVRDDVMENAAAYAKPAFESIEDLIKTKILPTVNKVSTESKADKALAKSLLTGEQAITPKELYDTTVEKLMEDDILFMKDGVLHSNAGAGVLPRLESQKTFADALAGEKGYLDQKDLSRWYDSVGKDARYGAANPSEVANAYKRVRGAVNDRLKMNEGFKEAMESSASKTSAAEKFREAMGLQKGERGAPDRYEFSEQNISKLISAAKKDSDTAKVIDDFIAKYGEAGPGIDRASLQTRVALNQNALGAKSPSFRFLGGVASGNIPAAVSGAALDVGGSPFWKLLATKLSSSAPSFNTPNLMPFLSPAAVNLSTSPIIGESFNPYANP